MPSIASALARAKGLGVDSLDAQLVLAHCLRQRRTWLLAHRDARLTAAQAQSFAALLERRASGEPLAYLVGEKEFRGLMLNVDNRVLVPRPETEHLVDWGLEALAARTQSMVEPRVLDLGTGSGAIALAVKSSWPGARVTAVDLSSAALEVAAANAARLALEIEFVSGDWWQAVPDRRFDLVLCNPPYVAAADPGLPALRHEPMSALTSGPSGFDALLQVIRGASRHLEPGGWLLLEHGADQAAAVREALRNHGLAQIQTRVDLAGLERCSAGRYLLG